MDERFSDWLRASVPSEQTWSTKMSEVRRLERTYGDLDAHFLADGLESITGELEYSRVDERNDEPNPSKLDINGNIYESLSSYRSALKKYLRFSEAQATPQDTAVSAETVQARDLNFRYEQDLQTALIACIDQVEPGLRMAEHGKERQVASGRIDALALDASGAPVVIELKAVTAKREVLGQIAAYMADIEDETGTRPRGILIAPDFDPKLRSAARMVTGLTLMTYTFSFTFDTLQVPS